MDTNLVILLLAVCASTASQTCISRTQLKPYEGTKIVFPEQFPVRQGYDGNLTCGWEVITEGRFIIAVYPRIWNCGLSTDFSLFYGLSESAEIDTCVSCPFEKGYCDEIIQTLSSEVVLDLFTRNNDATGGFDFRFMAVNASVAVDDCSNTGKILRADRSAQYIASPNFPNEYPSDLNCVWIIEHGVIDNNTHLVFQFQSQMLEIGGINTCTDYVTIEGLEKSCETDKDKIFLPSEKIYYNTTRTSTKVTFVSDFGGGGSGFVLSYYIEDIDEPCLCQNSGTCLNKTCLCPFGYKGEYCEKESLEIKSLEISKRRIREENNVWLSAEITDTIDFSVQWFRNDILVTNAALRYKIQDSNNHTNYILNITKTYTRDSGTWKVVAFNGVTSVSKSISINVYPKLRLKMDPQFDFSIQSEETLNLTCIVLNPESLYNLSSGSLVWLKDGKNILAAAGLQIRVTNTSSTLQKILTNSDDSGKYSCYHSSYPDPVEVSVQVTVTKKEQVVCPETTEDGIEWTLTFPNTESKKACPGDQIGTAKRFCDSNGIWKDPNLVNCTNRAFNEAAVKLTELREDGVNNTEEVERVVSSTLETVKNLTSTAAELSAGDIQSSLDIIEAVVNVTALSGAHIEKEVFFEVVDNVLSKNNSDSWNAVKSETTKDASLILKNMDKLSEEIIKRNDTKFNFSGSSFELSMNQVRVKEEDIVFPLVSRGSFQSETEKPATFLQLPKQTQISKSNTEINYVAVIYKTISEILQTDTDVERKEKYNIETEERSAVKEYVNSDILSLTTEIDLGILTPPLRLEFDHKKKQNQSRELIPVCVSWNFTLKSWTEKGCQKNSSNEKSTVCICNHLTNFAVLMRPYTADTVDSSSLKTLSLVGVVLSIVFIALTITIYVVTWKHVKNDQNTMLLNLCVSLIVSYIVFITAVEKTENEISCKAITATIHYLFLVTFFSMLSMGIYYFMSITVTYYAMYVANNFKSRSRVHWFLFGTWGIPLVISLSTLGGFWERGYHLEHYCWLSIGSGSLYLFIVPVCCTIVMNLIVIISLIRVLLASSVMTKSSLQNKAKSGLRSLGTLLPVLGVTWLFGLLAVNENADFFQYLFIIANSFQGFFIFVSHVILNKKLMLGLRTQYPSLGVLTSFAESTRKHTTDSHSHSIASETLLKQHEKKGFWSKFGRLPKKSKKSAKHLETSDTFLTERTTSSPGPEPEEKVPLNMLDKL